MGCSTRGHAHWHRPIATHLDCHTSRLLSIEIAIHVDCHQWGSWHSLNWQQSACWNRQGAGKVKQDGTENGGTVTGYGGKLTG